MISIGLVTIHFKNSQDTKALLSSLKKVDTKNINLKLYVVDNASNNGTMEEVEKAFPNIISIKSPRNLGFAGGNNLGINRALKDKCDYLLLINNDAVINEKDFFTNLLQSKGDIISPLVKYRISSRLTYDYGGKVDYLFGRNTHYSSPPSTMPDYYSGVCLFIKAKVFKRVKSLDDGFFLYYEDADFCLRAQEVGFKLGFCPQASIFHNLSSSTNKLGKKKLTILANSHLRFCLRQLPFYSAPFYFGFNLYLRLKTLI
jgi:GT2 family glycosyltransferase